MNTYFDPYKKEQHMKPFNLEAAKRGEPIVTRDGDSRFFIGTNKRCEIIVEDVSSAIFIMFFDGMTHTGKPSRLDLFMATKKRTVWANYFPNGLARYYETEYLADHAFGNAFRLFGKAYPVEVEE